MGATACSVVAVAITYAYPWMVEGGHSAAHAALGVLGWTAWAAALTLVVVAILLKVTERPRGSRGHGM